MSTSNYIDDSALQSALAGTDLSGLTLNDVSIFGTMMDDTTIGAQIPAAGNFRDVQIGWPTTDLRVGQGYKLTVYANNGDYMWWDPTSSLLDIEGGLKVRDGAIFGNLRIRENYLEAVNTNGNVQLLPNGTGMITLEGPLTQVSNSPISLEKATKVAIKSDTSISLTTVSDDIVLQTNFGAGSEVGIVSLTTAILSPNDPNQTQSVVVQTDLPHGMAVGQTAKLTGTNSIPSLDGSYIVDTIIDNLTYSFVFSGILLQNGGNVGTSQRDKIAKIILDSGKGYFFNENVPMYFVGGASKDAFDSTTATLDLLPQISGGTFVDPKGDTFNQVVLRSRYIRSNDPIVTLTNYLPTADPYQSLGILTSSGVLPRFFGFQNDQFTVLSNAAVTANADGSKTVTGTKGSINVDRVVTNYLVGNPDVQMSVSGSIQLTASSFVNIPDNVPFYIGTIGTFKSNTTFKRVEYSSTGDIRFQIPVDNVFSIPTKVPISFNDACPQQIYGDPTGLHVKVACGDLWLDVRDSGRVVIPYNVSLQMGATTSPTISTFTTSSTGLTVTSDQNITLSPTGSVIIPQSKKLQFGSLGTNYVILNDAGALSMYSSGAMNLNSGLDLNLQPQNKGNVNISTPFVVFKANTQLTFGPTATIDNYSSNLTIRVPSYRIALIAPNIDLSATAAINVPMNVPVKFGTTGSISLSPTSGDLIVANSGTGRVVLDSTTVINGNLQVNGTSTYIHSTVSTYTDTLLSLATDAAVGDVKDRGFEFPWFNGSDVFHGAFVFQQSPQSFALIQDGVNNNEQYAVNTYGDLRMKDLTARNVACAQIALSKLVGNPDLTLSAASIYLTATSSVVLPPNVPLISLNNTLVGTVNGWSVTSSNFNIKNGSMSLGSATFTLTDINNLHVGGVPNVWIDSTLYVGSSIRFGSGQVAINVDAQQNMSFNTTGNIVMSSLALLNGGSQMGNANMTWSYDIPGGGIIWKNTLPNAPLIVSLRGQLIDCTWGGSTIDISHGGTGHVGAWTAGSVVFVGSTSVSFEEDNANFFWSQQNARLGIRTATPTSAITIGEGDFEFAGNTGSLFFRTGGKYMVRLGKDGTNIGFFVADAPTTDKTQLTIPRFVINQHGQIGIGQTSSFMAGLSGLPPEAQMYIGGSVRLTGTSANVGWTTTEYMDNLGGFFNLNARSGIQLKGPTWVDSITYYGLAQTDIYIKADDGTSMIPAYTSNTGRLLVSSPYLIQLHAPHVLIDQRLCFLHDMNGCQVWMGQVGTNLVITSNVGDIIASPLNNLILADRKGIALGNAGTLTSNGSLFTITSTGVMQVSPGDRINIDMNKPLTFGNITQFVQNTGLFSISSTTPIEFQTTVGMNENAVLYFGQYAHRIVSDGDILRIFSKDLMVLDANNVRITGNLIVTGQTSVTIASETNFDTGIVTMGGAQSLNITTMEPWRDVQTLVTVSAPHSLVVGDTVNIIDSVPEIDGTYSILEVPTPSSFAVAIIYPGANGVPTQGIVRSALVSNPNVDVGIQANWFTGQANDTTGARAAFFGFKRSTQRFTYYVTGHNNAGIFTGVLGDMEIGTLFANSINVATLSGPLSAFGQIVSGDNFVITGGSINATPIGMTTPAAGTFTNLTVTGTLTVGSTTPVTNLNADLLDGYHASAFVMRDGSTTLTSSWDAGAYGISATGLADKTLTSTCVVFAGALGALTIRKGFTFDNTTDTLSVPFLAGLKMAGDLNLNGCSLVNGLVSGVNISNSNYILGSANTFDARLGTVQFKDSQIYGSWVGGGTAAIDISGTAAFVQNGVYTTDFVDHSVLKADFAGSPVALPLTTDTFVGRRGDGPIAALTLTDAREMLGITTSGPEALYKYGAVMRSGHLEFPDGGTMTGNLYPSFEIVTLETNQTLSASVDVKYSFVNISYSTGYYVATLVLPDGLHTPQEKNIVLTLNQPGCEVHVRANFGACKESGAITTCKLQFVNQSVSFVWFQDRWIIMPTGGKLMA